MNRKHRPLFIGHRGARALEAENTLGSFRKALEARVDMIEFDVHCCASGEPVVIHDATVNRTTNGRGRVSRLPFSRLRKFRCANNEPIPTLEETLRAIGARARVNVELKSVACVPAVARLFRRRDLSGVLFSSFKWGALRALRSLLPRAEIGLLFTERSSPKAPFAAARALRAVSLNLPARLVSKRLVERAHRAGLKVLAFGIQGDEDLERCFDAKADGMFLDDPGGAMRRWREISLRRPGREDWPSRKD
jgi:glycerophosphoryl diester phosphodiesterase